MAALKRARGLGGSFGRYDCGCGLFSQPLRTAFELQTYLDEYGLVADCLAPAPRAAASVAQIHLSLLAETPAA
jgi:hypothetical protein